MFRPILSLIAIAAFCVSMTLPVNIGAAAVQQETKQQESKQQETKQNGKRDTKPAAKSDSKDTKFTAEQIVESTILIYGTRPGLEQIRRNGVERGKITRFPATGNPEEADYERRFIRGENLEKEIADAAGKTFITMFASNVARMSQVFESAERLGKRAPRDAVPEPGRRRVQRG